MRHHHISTIGLHKERTPVIADGVLVFPNSAITGDCKIGDGAVINQRTSVLDCDVVSDTLAIKGPNGCLSFRNTPVVILDACFRKSC